MRSNILKAFDQKRQLSNLFSIYHANLEIFTIKILSV